MKNIEIKNAESETYTFIVYAVPKRHINLRANDRDLFKIIIACIVENTMSKNEVIF